MDLPIIITFHQLFNVDFVGVGLYTISLRKDAYAKVAAQVTNRVFGIVKRWEDTKTVRMGSRIERVHNHGYERIAKIVDIHMMCEESKRTGVFKRQWEWCGSGSCRIRVESFAEKILT